MNTERDNPYIVIEKEIVWQCAPVILGIKTANLLVLHEKYNDLITGVFKNTELSLYCLCSYESKVYYLLYQPYKLARYIHEQQNYGYLTRLGYSLDENEHMIQTLAYKYKKYMQDKQQFPHEIGIMLGYPLEDVLNFISHNGTGYLYSGYWKVYDNLSEAQSVFARYQKAREVLYRFITEGGRLGTVMKEVIRYT